MSCVVYHGRNSSTPKGWRQKPRMSDKHDQYLADAIRIIAGSMGHELNNQLTIILGNSGLAKRKCPDAKNYVNNIETATEKIISKTRRVTALASRMGGARGPVSLREQMESALATVAADTPGPISIESTIEVSAEVQVRMDRLGLPSALYFCVYALGGSGGQPVQITVQEHSDDQIDITVVGSGEALNEEILSLAPSSAEDILLGENSVGIGLSASKAFTHRCQGTFHLARESSGQACITMRLPAVRKPTSFR
jgi:phosphoglycerate-specific signal transduction histidine kinase